MQRTLDMLIGHVGDQLNAIEHLTLKLGTLTEAVNTLTLRVKTNTQDIDALTQRMNTITKDIDTLTSQMKTNSHIVDNLTSRMETNSRSVDNLTFCLETATRYTDNNTQYLQDLVELVDSLAERVSVCQHHRLQSRPQSREPQGGPEGGMGAVSPEYEPEREMIELIYEQGDDFNVDYKSEDKNEAGEGSEYEVDDEYEEDEVLAWQRTSTTNNTKALTSTFKNEGLNLLFDQVAGLYQQPLPAVVANVAPHIQFWSLNQSLESLLNRWFNSEGNSVSVWSLEAHDKRWTRVLRSKLSVYHQEKRIVRTVLERVRKTHGLTLEHRLLSAKAVIQAAVLRAGSMSAYDKSIGRPRRLPHKRSSKY
ncbi:hypothetical protein BGX33_001490 [Mortierella sp. NVP41]|nr:hypothetical protein BGX33_001490 [Mortierella sp. NVP41]